MRDSLSLKDARRIALAAQGFGRPHPRRAVKVENLAAIIRRLGLVQLDYVKVVIPAHYLVFYSRLGSYDRSLFEKTVYETGEFTEQWAHEASIIPVETWPLLRHRMAERRFWPYGFENFIDANSVYCSGVLEQIRTRGPLTAREIHHPEHIEHKLEGSWYGTIPRAVLEAHFLRGRLAVARRDDTMSRVFDLPERVLRPDHVTRSVTVADANRELLRVAARAYGIAKAADLADYFRMPLKTAAPRIAELVDAGELLEVQVEGSFGRAYLSSTAPRPKPVNAATLLAPFDPLIWFRARALRLFNFDYRFEIFVPAEKRKHGAYVLPFLLGESLPARVDLKSDRARGRLLVQGAFLETGEEPDIVAEALAAELRTLAAWLGLKQIVTGRRGNLARTLARKLS